MLNHYRNLAATFFINTFWCIYVFFDYFTDNSFLSGLTLFSDYTYTLVSIFLVSAIMLVLRFTKYRVKVLKSFFYTFAAYANLLLFLVYWLYLIFSHSVREFFNEFALFNFLVVIALFLGAAFLTDIYKHYLVKNVEPSKP